MESLQQFFGVRSLPGDLPELDLQLLSADSILTVGDSSLPNKLRFVCISDTHLKHRSLTMPEGDVLIHAGDFSHWRKGSMDKIREFNAWLGDLKYSYKFLNCGNHEVHIPTEKELAQKILTNVTYLQDDKAEIGPVKVYGAPWHNARAFW